MRIAFDVSYVQRRMTGIGHASLNLLRALLDADPANKYLLHGWSWSLDFSRVGRMRASGVDVSLCRIPGAVKRTYWQQLRFPSIENIIGDFDLFHSVDPFLPPTRKPTIATLHDVISFDHPEWFMPSVTERHRALLRGLETAEAIIVPSRHVLERLRDLAPSLGSRASVVHWPVGKNFRKAAFSPEVVTKPAGREAPYVLFVGTIEPRKNVEGLLRAFEEYVAPAFPELRLTIVGRMGWKSRVVASRLRDLSQQGKVRVLGYVQEGQLPALYRNASLFVYPSFDEGFGLPVLEAMACGLPVLTSDIPPMRELWGMAASLVNPGDVQSLAAGMIALLQDSSLRSRVQAEGGRKVLEMSPEASAAGVLRLYGELAGR